MNYIYAVVAAVILALVAALGAQTYRVNSLQKAISEKDTKIAQMNEAAQEEARASENRIAEARAEAGKRFEKEKEDAKKEAERIRAGLTDGSIRLRREWAACETQRLSEGAASERELGQIEQRQRDSAERIVRAADECRAQVDALIKDAHDVRVIVNGASSAH